MDQRETQDGDVSQSFDSTVDIDRLNSISPHPPGDQVDRSIVVGEVVKSAALWSVRIILIIAMLYLVAQVAGNFWQGILPVVLALIICTVLSPVARTLRQWRVPGALAAILTILGAFGLVGALIASIAPSFARQSQSLYLQSVEGIQRLQIWAQGPPLNLNSEDMGAYIDEVASWLQQRAGNIAGSVFTGIGTATSVVITLFIVIVLTFFFLKDGHRFLPWLRRAAGRRTGWHLTELLTRGWNTLGGFVRAQALVSLVDAIFIGLGLLLIGVPLALALAIITFIAGFIPFVGAIVAGALSVLIALVSLGVTQALLVLGLVLLVQQLEGNVLSPWLQSKAMDLHPVIVLVSVTIGSALFNLIGAFLAVPAAAMIAVGYRYFQDQMMLQSGEKRVEDIQFTTVAGYLAGRYSESQGAHRRAAWRDEPSQAASTAAAEDLVSDDKPEHADDDVNMDATPGAPTSSPAGSRTHRGARSAGASGRRSGQWASAVRGAFDRLFTKRG